MSWGRDYRHGRSGPLARGFHQQGQVFDYGHSRPNYNARHPPQPSRRPFQPPQNQFNRRVPFEEDEDDDDDDDEELIPLPEDLTRKFGKLTCELCLCTLPTVRQANMHYEGKQHEKRVMRYLEEWSHSSNRNIPNCWLKLVCKRKKNTKLPQGCDDKFCGVCNIVLTSAVVAEQHYSGRAHNSALKLYKGKNGARDIQSNAKSQFICDICNVVTSCQEHLENHMRGSKHKKVLEKLKDAETLEMYGGYDDEEEEEEEEIPEYNVIQSSSGDVQYECVYCTWRGKPAEFEAHKEKLTHIAAVEEEAKRKANLDYDDDDDEDDCTEYTDVTDLFCKLCNVQLTSKKEVAKHVRSRDHLEEVNLRKKQVMLSLDDQKKSVVEEEHKCDLCLMKFPSKSMYDAHLQWKRHIKKVANKMQSQCIKKCELCQMDFYSEEMYNAHLNTKRHRGNEQWLKKKECKTDLGSKVSANEEKSENEVTVITEENKDNEKSTDGNKSAIKTEESVDKSETRNVEVKSEAMQVDSDKSVEDKDSGKKTSEESANIFECDVCMISVTGKLPFEQHLISTRHILQCSLRLATVSDKKEQNAPIKSAKVAAVPLFCKLCHVTSLTTYQHELHVSSKKHMDAVTKLEVLKYEPKLKMAMSYKPPASQNTSAAERNSGSQSSENFGKPGNFREQFSSRQFDNTGVDDRFHSRNQPVFSERSHFTQPQREMSNIPPHNDLQQPFRQDRNPVTQPYGVPQPLGVDPNVPLSAGSTSYFPPTSVVGGQYFAPTAATQAQHFAPTSVTQAQHFAPTAVTQAQYFAPTAATQAQYFAPTAATQAQHFAPTAATQVQHFAPPSTTQAQHFTSSSTTQAQHFASPSTTQAQHLAPPSTQQHFAPPLNPPTVRNVKTPRHSSNNTADPPPIRRATYSCKDCGASFISGVDYKHHANTCKKKVRSEEIKAQPPKKSSVGLHNDHYHCEACDIEYTSYRAFLEHKASVEHEANIEHLREFGKRLQPVHKEKKTSQVEHLSKERNEKKGLHSSKQYECKRCDVAFFSQQSFNRHINSAGHLRKPVTFKREIVTYREEVNLPSSSRDRNTRYGRERRRSSERSSRDYPSRNSDRKRMSSSSSDSDEMELLPRKKARGQQYECTVCDKIYSLEIEYKEHLKSKTHRSKMCMYECSDCTAVFSSKNDLSNHMCDLGKIRSIGRSNSDRQLQKYDSYRRDSFEDNTFLDVDEDFEISNNLLSSENKPESSLLSSFSFKRETYEIMSDSHGMPTFNY